MLTTPWSTAMGLTTPLVNAPMGGVAGGALALAVSRAGGLGMIGVGTTGSVELIERESAIVRDGGQAFGIGLIGWALERDPSLLSAAIDAAPVMISLSFADVEAWEPQVHDAAILLAAQIYDVPRALRARAMGADVIVARGGEGGGHGRNDVATLPLLQAVLDAVDIPVLAAGGIANARGLAAVLAAGAAGAWIGTAFIACPESLTPAVLHARLFESSETDTIYTRAADVAMGYPWPTEYGERVLRNKFFSHWTGEEERLAGDVAAREQFAEDRNRGDVDVVEIDAGQGVGMIRSSHPAHEIVTNFTKGATELLGRWASNTPA